MIFGQKIETLKFVSFFYLVEILRFLCMNMLFIDSELGITTRLENSTLKPA